MTTHADAPPIDEKDQELIAVGASIASDRVPCAKLHPRAAVLRADEANASEDCCTDGDGGEPCQCGR
jgi:AhpD family alkylhydroperoxidase